MRNPNEYKQKMLEVVPAYLKQQLENINEENWHAFWYKLTIFVHLNINHPVKEDWQIKLIALLLDKSEEEIRRSVEL